MSMSALLPKDSPLNSRASDEAPGPDTRLVQESLNELRAQISSLSVKMEQPILEVGVFLESIQDLEAAKPVSEGGSRLVVAIQAYDFFRQEIQLVEELIGKLNKTIAEASRAVPSASPGIMMTKAAEVHYHLASARGLIENAAAEIPHAITQVLRGAGVNSNRFQNWSVHRSLAELSVLTKQLGCSVDEVEAVRLLLASTFGVSVSDTPEYEAPQRDNEAGSVLLF